ncbi:hypothetical protein [Shewanella gaetbuli]|uniref:Outer membrane protein beta-barrel domain-containing protein n=1 Tax=Shewanella gaetbuli TaxID=220752 RepID=A0A9X1ZN13_9GAMM|nr:hypothetical protein [Shewanella gaetbuli]MCL1143952.1 hypothetical protein [Shewanella gaetbuli]
MKTTTLITSSILFTAVTVSTAVKAAPEVGVMVGSDSGLNVKIHDYKIGVGFDDLSFTLDKMFNFEGHPHFYWGIGGKIADTKHDDTKLGARAVFGAHTKVERFTFFIEAQPTLYLIDDVKVKLEAIGGVRYHF